MKKHYIDLSQLVGQPTIQSTQETIVKNIVARRKELKLSQKALASKSGVSYGSIKRFETSYEVSLISLIKLANALGLLEDLNKLFTTPIVTDLSKDWK